MNKVTEKGRVLGVKLDGHRQASNALEGFHQSGNVNKETRYSWNYVGQA